MKSDAQIRRRAVNDFLDQEFRKHGKREGLHTFTPTRLKELLERAYRVGFLDAQTKVHQEKVADEMAPHLFLQKEYYENKIAFTRNDEQEAHPE